MYRSLACIARFEFNALMQDTKRAVESLKLQQESVVQALETARQAHATAGLMTDETAMQLHRLEIRLRRLHHALDQVIAESDGVEALPFTPSVAPALTSPVSESQLSPQPSPAFFSQWKRIRELSERFLKTCCRKVAPLMPSWVKGAGLPCG
jgi:hypothetical protein